MMKKLILRLRNSFELLSLRERALCTLLLWALIYAVFSLLFFRPAYNERVVYLTKIKETKGQINTLNLQVDAIDKIAASPLYLEWKKQHETYEAMQKHYKTLITSFSANNIHDVIKTIVASQTNIALAHIEHSNEVPFAPQSKAESGPTIFQQSISLVVYGDYLNIIRYLKDLEKAMPNIHWDSLKYEVMNYPTARMTIGFSIFYGKNSNS